MTQIPSIISISEDEIEAVIPFETNEHYIEKKIKSHHVD
jgi:hypothetical protein